MPNPRLPGVTRPYSLVHARQGGMNGHTSPQSIVMHERLLTRDYYTYRDEFDTLTIANDTFWATAATGAGSAAPVVAAVATRGMCAQFVTGGGNPGVSTLYGANAAAPSANNPWLYARVILPAAVTNFAFEIGFVNVYTTKTTAGISALSAAAVPTFTNGVTDGVLLAMNTGYTLTTPALAGVGTSTAAAGVIVANSAGTAYSPTAAKVVDVYLQAFVAGGYCQIVENDALIFSGFVASGPDTAVMLFPVFQFRDLGTSKTVNIAVVEHGFERNDR